MDTYFINLLFLLENFDHIPKYKELTNKHPTILSTAKAISSHESFVDYISHNLKLSVMNDHNKNKALSLKFPRICSLHHDSVLNKKNTNMKYLSMGNGLDSRYGDNMKTFKIKFNKQLNELVMEYDNDVVTLMKFVYIQHKWIDDNPTIEGDGKFGKLHNIYDDLQTKMFSSGQKFEILEPNIMVWIDFMSINNEDKFKSDTLTQLLNHIDVVRIKSKIAKYKIKDSFWCYFENVMNVLIDVNWFYFKYDILNSNNKSEYKIMKPMNQGNLHIIKSLLKSIETKEYIISLQHVNSSEVLSLKKFYDIILLSKYKINEFIPNLKCANLVCYKLQDISIIKCEIEKVLKYHHNFYKLLKQISENQFSRDVLRLCFPIDFNLTLKLLSYLFNKISNIINRVICDKLEVYCLEDGSKHACLYNGFKKLNIKIE